MDLTVVTTLYLSSPYIKEFCSRVEEAVRVLTDSYEIILVNDGSPDDSLEQALLLLEKNPRLKVIDLSRNFGHHKAIMTGLAHARGDLVFLIDCDLEEQPELLNQFHEKMREVGADAVFGVVDVRKGGLFERLSGSIFFRLFNFLSRHPVVPNQTIARLMSARYVRALLSHRESEIYFGGLCAITGFKQIPLTVTKVSKGESSYGLGLKISSSVNALTAFSDRPLVLVFYLGLLIIGASASGILYLLIRKFFFGTFLAGWPSLILSVWLLGGLTIFCLGVIGVYLSRMFMEVKHRPSTIVREIYQARPGPPGGADPTGGKNGE